MGLILHSGGGQFYQRGIVGDSVVHGFTGVYINPSIETEIIAYVAEITLITGVLRKIRV